MAAATPGDFSPTQLLDAILLASTAFPDNLINAEERVFAQTYQALKDHDTSNLEILQVSEKDYTVRIDWLDGQVTPAQACTDDCDVTGPELGTVSETRTLNNCVETSGSFKYDVFRTNTMSPERVAAELFQKMDRELSQAYCDNALAAIEAHLGANLSSQDGGATSFHGWNINANVTEVPSAQMNTTFFGKSLLEMQLSLYEPSEVFMLNGTNLYQDWYNSAFQRAGCCENPDAAYFTNGMRKYWDIYNIPTPDTYFINEGTFALVDKARYSFTPVSYSGNAFGQTRFKMASNILQGVEWDVIQTQKCAADGISVHYKAIGRFDTLTAPLGANMDRTGVTKYTVV